MIKRWHYFVMGFTQTIAEPTGVEDLWLEMRDLTSADAAFILKPWDANWELEAAFINRCSDPNPLISIYAYSWGVGNGFVQLACELAKLKLAVRTAVLCDPITYNPLAPWQALVDSETIAVPDNVGEVWWCFQKNDPHLRGHGLMGADTTLFHPGEDLSAGGVVHATIDSADWFHAKAREVAQLIEAA
jgi:hypothetical protein